MITTGEVRDIIIEIAKSGLNTMKLKEELAFDEPLVAFGAGDDPLFMFYKQDIGDFLWLPDQWLELKYNKKFDNKNVTVISWVLPQTESTKKMMKDEREYPCYEWSLVRTFGEEFNRTLGLKVEEYFNCHGIEAVAPLCNDAFKWEQSEKYGYASNWSERHTAYICGLGTFGLCDGLISKAGKAARYGSVIVNVDLPKTKRAYTSYNEYCLAKDGCTACMKRCPAGAITREGHDKNKCVEYQKGKVVPYAKEHFGFEGIYGCGLCQTNVPCQSRVPKKFVDC